MNYQIKTVAGVLNNMDRIVAIIIGIMMIALVRPIYIIIILHALWKKIPVGQAIVAYEIKRGGIGYEPPRWDWVL